MRYRAILNVSILLVPLIIFVTVLFSCGNDEKTETVSVSKTDSLRYLNHHDSVRYVGKETCRQCHAGIYSTFIETGMGESFGAANQQKSAADFKHSILYDKDLDFWYKAYWYKDTFRLLEFRMKGRDTVHKRIETIDFIVGSGQHTNSHLQMLNGYVTQAPMTFYTQKKQWDLPPGFEEGHNSRFSRLIGLECMTCHNAYPDFVEGSENKFSKIPEGIDCERCHGPGSLHVARKQAGELIDTSKYIDYTIVNPAKLDVDRQFDVCMRCHLQGNAVLEEGKSFYSFKPGMKLSDHMSVFLPRYSNSEKEFIMASHADRLKQSPCFIETLKKNKSQKNQLKPYKDALTCVTCHNPHVSVRQTSQNHFNNTCNNCHAKAMNNWCTERETVLRKNDFNCVSCHMPSSGSKDIPHVSIHDHYIRKPVKTDEKNKIKEFIGLYAVNNSNPSELTMAKAYIAQFEKFERQNYFLDSAMKYVSRLTGDQRLGLSVQVAFLREDFQSIISQVKSAGIGKVLQSMFNTASLDNENAWVNYRIGEAFYKASDFKQALAFYAKAAKLAPFNIEFKIKQGATLLMLGNLGEARTLFNSAIVENPKNVSALTNLGYTYALEGKYEKAMIEYEKAVALDPDYLPLKINRAGLFVILQKHDAAEQILLEAASKHKNNNQLKQMLVGLSQEYLRIKQPAKASALFKKIIKLYPADKDILSLKTQFI